MSPRRCGHGPIFYFPGDVSRTQQCSEVLKLTVSSYICLCFVRGRERIHSFMRLSQDKDQEYNILATKPKSLSIRCGGLV